MKYTNDTTLKASMEYINVQLTITDSEKQLIDKLSKKYKSLYIRYCKDQIRRICNGVPMVFPDIWFHDNTKTSRAKSLSSRIVIRTLTYGFDLIVRNQKEIRKHHNPTMTEAFNILLSLPVNKFEYGLKNNSIFIPKQEGMEGNLFKKHKIHIPKVGKFSVSDKEMKKVPDNIKIKMIRIFTKGSDVYANIAYIRLEERDDEGFITLIKKHYPTKVMEVC